MLQDLFEYLHQDQIPTQLSERVDKRMSEIGSEAVFSDPKYQKLLEAWILGKFGEKTGATHVKLNTGTFPDGFAEIDGNVIELEICEAYSPGRKRADEYRQTEQDLIIEDPFEDWIARCRSSIEGLKSVLKKKSRKHYPAGVSLLIYISDCGSYGAHSDYMHQNIEKCTKPYLKKFSNFWILWDGNLTHLAGHPRV